MNARHFLVSLALIVWACVGVAAVAVAQMTQIPPHPPGTICFTERFWCWAQPPGPPGTPCTCRTPEGVVVPGVRG